MFFILILVANCFLFSSEVLEYAQKHLTLSGTLKNSNGFVYVDVDDDYIHELIHLIEDSYDKPPYFGSKDLAGAHISVIFPDENKDFDIKELGKIIPFQLKQCSTARPENFKGVEEVYFIVVDAPKLDEIRKKYGLLSKKYEYHITIGVKKKAA